jgi:hypothetical protein
MNLVVNLAYLHEGMICCCLQHGALIFASVLSCVSNTGTKLCSIAMHHLVINLFTRKVYLEYRQVFDKSAAFRMYPNPGVPNGFLVKHQWGGRGFYWSNDAFRVYADVVQGEYRCECRQWKHTSKFLNNYNNMFCICHDSCHCNIPATPDLAIVTSDSYLGS